MLRQLVRLDVSEDSIEDRNQQISKQLIEEVIKKEQVMSIIEHVKQLRERNPNYMREYYEVSRGQDWSMSELEYQSKLDLEISRYDTKLWLMLEKDKKKLKKIARQLAQK